jgi:hypothetical protein
MEVGPPVLINFNQDFVGAVLYLEMGLVEHIVLFRWTEEAGQEAIESAMG